MCNLVSQNDRHHPLDESIDMIEGMDGERKANSLPPTINGTTTSGNGASGGNIIRDHLVSTYLTKNTPISYLSFTPRNLCLAAGVFAS